MELFGAKLEVRDGLPPDLMVPLDSLTALAVNAESRVDVGAIVRVEFRLIRSPVKIGFRGDEMWASAVAAAPALGQPCWRGLTHV